MAAYDYTRTPAARPVTFGRPGAFVASLFATVVDWNEARLTRRSLNKLTDRELDDIGLHRGDIESVAEEGKLRF